MDGIESMTSKSGILSSKRRAIPVKVAMLLFMISIGGFNTGCTCANSDVLRIYSGGASNPNSILLDNGRTELEGVIEIDQKQG